MRKENALNCEQMLHEVNKLKDFHLFNAGLHHEIELCKRGDIHIILNETTDGYLIITAHAYTRYGKIVLLIDREGNITDSDRPNCKAEHLAEEITVRLKAYVNALEKANAPLKWVKKFKRGGGK